jgi:hypothetical protein
MNAYPVTVLHHSSNVEINNPFPIHLSSFPSEHIDAFGRLRMSTPLTLFDSFHRYQDNGKMNEYSNQTAYSTFDSNSCSVVMTVGSNLGDKIYRETSKVFAYQPGKSLLVFQTFSMNTPKIGLRQRQGYFDVSNGIYIEQNGLTLSFVRRSIVSGIVKDFSVPQHLWNVDTMNGFGLSRYTLDVTRTQIMFMDIEWLGVGSVRVGFVINGKLWICHIFHHANQPSTNDVDTSLPYMSTACLPVRAELENTKSTNSYSQYRLICTTVISEGGYELKGKPRSAGFSILDVPYSIPIKNTVYPVMSLRLKSNRLNAIVIPTQFSIIGVVASDYRWVLILGASITNGTWTSGGSDSCVEYTITATNAITDGVILKSGFFTATTNTSPSITLDSGIFKYQLERNSFTNTATTFTLAISSKAANDKVLGSIDWEEIT